LIFTISSFFRPPEKSFKEMQKENFSNKILLRLKDSKFSGEKVFKEKSIA